MSTVAQRLGLGTRSGTRSKEDLAAAASERLYAVLDAPHITEKVTQLGDASNHCAFIVAKDATKREIKEAVEALFGVTVEGVTTLNVKGRTKRNFRGQVSRKKSWKKAYVRLKAGDELDYSAVEA